MWWRNEAEVSLVTEDSQTDPGAGSSAMTKLAEVDRVAGVVGAFASSVSGAAVDVAVRNKVMMVSPGSNQSRIYRTSKKWRIQRLLGTDCSPRYLSVSSLSSTSAEAGF